MNNDILTQLSMIYTKVIPVENSEVYIVVENNKANLIKSDGTQVFSKDYNEIHDNEDYIKVVDNSNTIGRARFIGLYFKNSGNIKELDTYYTINDVDKYIIIENANSNYVEIIDKSNGNKIWAGDLSEYIVRLGDKTTPICLNQLNGDKLILFDKKVISLGEHLKEHYASVEKIKGTKGKYLARCKRTGEEFKLTEYGQKY